jgi:hypothetical protein
MFRGTTSEIVGVVHGHIGIQLYADAVLLGDWSATILLQRPSHLVLAVSERTLLPILLEAAPLASLAERLRDEVSIVVHRLGGSAAIIEEERAAMESLCSRRRTAVRCSAL